MPIYELGDETGLHRCVPAELGTRPWGARLDIEAFVETGERINFALKKADDSFYGVVFASKGSSQLAGLYSEARKSVNEALRDFDELVGFLRQAGAPGV